MADRGIADLHWERIARLHESMRARGASEAAMARLPKLPRKVEEVTLRPVLATRSDAVNVAFQDLGRRKKAALHKALAMHARIKREPIERDAAVEAIVGPIHPQVTARVKAIAGEVAKAAGVTAEELLAYATPRRLSRQKHMAIYLAAKLTDVGVIRLGEIFNYSDHTSARYAVQKAAYMLRMAYPSALDLHEKALTAIRTRWPEYEKGITS
ncbi:MAG: helix-turn-helix domain-containing protein [Acidobacteriota bacterium]